MKEIFVNMSNHPSSRWGQEQKNAAGNYYDHDFYDGTEIKDVPFPQIPAKASHEYVNNLAIEKADEIVAMGAGTVMLQGETSFCYAMNKALKERGILTVAALSEPNMVQNADGSVTKTFEFKGFREINSFEPEKQDKKDFYVVKFNAEEHETSICAGPGTNAEMQDALYEAYTWDEEYDNDIYGVSFEVMASSELPPEIGRDIGKASGIANIGFASAKWSDKQKEAAKAYGEVTDIKFPYVPIQATSGDIAKMAHETVGKITKLNPSAVICSGESALTYAITSELEMNGIQVIAGCSERNTIELPDGSKKVNFEFEQFREVNEPEMGKSYDGPETSLDEEDMER